MSERLISVLENAHIAGLAAASRSLPKETGGILAGWRTPGGIHVVEMLEVASRTATPSRYVRSERRAGAALHIYLKSLPRGTPVGYVGDWHSHPASQPASQIDLDSIAEFARNDAQPVALIVVSRRNERWDVSAWYAFRLGRRIVRLEQATSVVVTSPTASEPRGGSTPRIGASD